MSTKAARICLDAVWRTQVPRAAASDIIPGMQVMANRENPVDQREGACRVVRCSSKQVRLNVNHKMKLFAVEKITEYVPAPVSGEPDAQTQAVPPPNDEQAGAIPDGIIAGDTTRSWRS